MHPNEKLITRFYDAFNNGDVKTMQEAYHPSATFSDPVFQVLSAAQVKAMWKMLTLSAKDLKIGVDDVKADDERGECRWEAWYTYSPTGRRVHNVISARFQFREGQIIAHHDKFSFWRWARMALGATGLFFGWSPFLRHAITRIARARLQRFMAAEAAKH